MGISIVITLLLVFSIVVNVWLLKQKVSPGRQSVRSTLMQGIQDVKELATLRQSFQSIVMYEDSKSVPILGFCMPGTTRKFILKYSGTVVCGNDLSNVVLNEIPNSRRVRIVVPRSRILDIYADMKSIQVYDQKAGIFSSIKLDDQNREIVQNLEEVRQDALQSDILRRADESTRALLAYIAFSMGINAEVIFDDKDTTTVHAPAATCEDEPVILTSADAPEQE